MRGKIKKGYSAMDQLKEKIIKLLEECTEEQLKIIYRFIDKFIHP